MSTDVFKEHKVAFISLAVVLLLGVSVWGYSVHARNSKKVVIPPELTVAALKKEEDPGKMWEKLRDPSLTEAQRDAIRQNMRAAFEARMEARMDEYFQAPANMKQAILDKQIDEMQVRMKDWEKRRAERDAQRQAAGGTQPSDLSSVGRNGSPGGPGDQAGANGAGGNNGQQNGRQGGRSREQRKNSSESRDPQQTAKRMAYFSAMQSRAQDRGIQMPAFGGGRRD